MKPQHLLLAIIAGTMVITSCNNETKETKTEEKAGEPAVPKKRIPESAIGITYLYSRSICACI